MQTVLSEECILATMDRHLFLCKIHIKVVLVPVDDARRCGRCPTVQTPHGSTRSAPSTSAAAMAKRGLPEQTRLDISNTKLKSHLK